jgi:hypothetical protein
METLAQENLCEDLRDINVVNLIVSMYASFLAPFRAALTSR